LAEVNHRDWLFMHVGWLLMDLRQDIEFAGLFTDGPDWKDVATRLAGLQNDVGAYADEHFPHVETAKDGEW